MNNESDRKFSDGAVRSSDADHYRFDLISPIAMLALARTYHEGAEKYGDMNWERGMPVHDLLNHVERHILMFKAGDRTEPHLPHAAWGIFAAIHSYELWPYLNDAYLRGPGCSLTPAIKARMADEADSRASRRKRGFFDGLAVWATGKLAEVVKIVRGAPEPKVFPASLEGQIEQEFDSRGITYDDIVNSMEPNAERPMTTAEAESIIAELPPLGPGEQDQIDKFNREREALRQSESVAKSTSKQACDAGATALAEIDVNRAKLIATNEASTVRPDPNASDYEPTPDDYF